MFRQWLVRYKRRGDRDADQLKLRRRFMQYLNLGGKKLPSLVARLGGRQVLSIIPPPKACCFGVQNRPLKGANEPKYTRNIAED